MFKIQFIFPNTTMLKIQLIFPSINISKIIYLVIDMDEVLEVKIQLNDGMVQFGKLG